MKSAALDPAARIHFHNIVLNIQSVYRKGAGRRRTDHLSPDIKCRRMAGAHKSLLFINPGNGAPEMGALAGNSQKAAIFQPAQVKFAPNKGGNGIERESVYVAGFNNRIGLPGFGSRFKGAKVDDH